MKLEDTKKHSVHLRLNDEQYSFLQSDAELLGVGVSDYIRMIINTTMVTTQKLANSLNAKLGDLKQNENNQDNFKHQL